MPYASGYSVDLYCDKDSPHHAFSEFPHQYVDEEKAVCWRKIKKAGWYVSRDGLTVLCPKCNPKSPRYKNPNTAP